MPYYIYKITSPSNKVYIGISIDVKKRWSSHKRKARSEDKRHPFYDAIRSHGHESFTVTTLSEHQDKDEAIAEEVRQIEEYGATDRGLGYNISRGGEYDGVDGSRLFWVNIRKDPEAYATYIENLSEGCKKRGGINVDSLIKYMKDLDPKERWRRAYRASRMAKRTTVGGKGTSYTPNEEQREHMSKVCKATWESQKTSFKKKWSIKARKDATKQWEHRTESEIADVSKKISSTLKTRYAEDEKFKAKNGKQLSTARDSIDRVKQGKAASKGIKNFWVQLRKDPVKYDAYMAARNATLKQTNLSKGYICVK